MERDQMKVILERERERKKKAERERDDINA